MNAKYTRDYKIELEFNDGKVQIVDFGPFLNLSGHSEVRKYLVLDEFKKFQIIDGDLDWNDFDLTFPIWDLYMNRLTKSVNSEEQEAS
jgi:hypothetical protein